MHSKCTIASIFCPALPPSETICEPEGQETRNLNSGAVRIRPHPWSRKISESPLRVSRHGKTPHRSYPSPSPRFPSVRFYLEIWGVSLILVPGFRSRFRKKPETSADNCKLRTVNRELNKRRDFSFYLNILAPRPLSFYFLSVFFLDFSRRKRDKKTIRGSGQEISRRSLL